MYGARARAPCGHGTLFTTDAKLLFGLFLVLFLLAVLALIGVLHLL